MRLAKVIGRVWATKKDDRLDEYKLLLVKLMEGGEGRYMVSADTVDAGIGDTVIIVNGSGARRGNAHSSDPLNSAIVGVVDEEKSKDL
mgnify:CR=1 FL=1